MSALSKWHQNQLLSSMAKSVVGRSNLTWMDRCQTIGTLSRRTDTKAYTDMLDTVPVGSNCSMDRGESRLTIPLMNGWDYSSTVCVIHYLVRSLISRSLLDAARDQAGPIWSERESQVLHMRCSVSTLASNQFTKYFASDLWM